jgi:hypothetical protein
MSDDSPTWTRRIAYSKGHLEKLRQDNPQNLFEYHVSEEMAGDLDAVVSQEMAQGIVTKMNEIGYPECQDHMAGQLAEVISRQYSNLALLFYVTDRCNRE